jgi:hypothetical protein
VGATGPAGSTGAIGPTGADGSSPAPQYAYVYNDIGETVAADTDVTFNSNGKMTAGISHTPGDAAIGFTIAGDYKVTFSVSATEVNQTALYRNGSLVAGTVYGSGAGVQQNTGQTIVTIGAGDTLTVRNLSVSTAYGLAPSIGGPVPTTNAAVVIEKLN